MSMDFPRMAGLVSRLLETVFFPYVTLLLFDLARFVFRLPYSLRPGIQFL